MNDTTRQDHQGEGAPKGAASFCIPRAAIQALLDAQANAYEICAYLVLAQFTDATGQFSTASISAVNRYTGANKVKGGAIDRAIKRLLTIRATRRTKVSNGRAGKNHAWIEQTEDLGPILIDRATWCDYNPDQPLPDGPTERGAVLYVLPAFGEDINERVWIASALVGGVGGFTQPLKALKDAGDVAARLLLALYEANDMETWGGVNPHKVLRARYEFVKDGSALPRGGARLLRAETKAQVASIDQRISGGSNDAYFDALRALQSSGLIYEMVLVLNRNPVPSKFASGEDYGGIDANAEPLYELDCRSLHGYKPVGEEGLAGITARTAGEFGRPVTGVEFDFDGPETSAQFNGTYAVIVPSGYGCQVAGIYRLRFRVANPKNAGVKGAWARIHQGNRWALEFINKVRQANKLPPLPAPWDQAKKARDAKATKAGPPRDPFADLFS
jgi:hypothetical protein